MQLLTIAYDSVGLQRCGFRLPASGFRLPASRTTPARRAPRQVLLGRQGRARPRQAARPSRPLGASVVVVRLHHLATAFGLSPKRAARRRVASCDAWSSARTRGGGRPHGAIVQHLGDGRWWNEADQTWRNGRGRRIGTPVPAEDQPISTTKVVLAAAHLDHDPSHRGRRHHNIRALCQRCHLLHDRLEHLRRRRRALGDLFSGPYVGS